MAMSPAATITDFSGRQPAAMRIMTKATMTTVAVLPTSMQPSA